MKVCLEPGCPTLTADSRCPTHTRAKDKARGTRQQRGYDAAHTRLRASYQRRMNRGETFTCWRCGRPIDPHAWHLGHDDTNRSRYRGPECVPCNTATASRQSTKRGTTTMTEQHPFEPIHLSPGCGACDQPYEDSTHIRGVIGVVHGPRPESN